MSRAGKVPHVKGIGRRSGATAATISLWWYNPDFSAMMPRG